MIALSPGRPLTWVSGNVVYGRSMGDPWAVLVLPTHSHAHQPHATRLERFWDLRDLCVDLAADFQILRLARWWDRGAYADDADDDSDRAAYVREQADGDGTPRFRTPLVLLCVSLTAPRRDASGRVGGALEDPRARAGAVLATRRRLGLGGAARPLRDVEQDHVAAEDALRRVAVHIPGVRPATLREVEWAVRRAWCRGLGEPEVDGLEEPRSLLFERNGEAVLRPHSVDLLSWGDRVRRTAHGLVCTGERGESHQVGLVASRVAGDAEAPSRVLESLFRPQDRLGFPIDLCLASAYVSPTRAERQVRQEMAKADEAADEEYAAARGVSDRTQRRTQTARAAEDYLDGGAPLFESVLTGIVAAPDEAGCRAAADEVVAAFRRHDVTMRVPVAQQLEAFWTHLPAQRPWVAGFTRRLTAEQIAAMAPTAARRIGGRRGYVWGRTLSASPTVVRWSPEDGSRLNTASGVLMVGDSGSGKTTAAAKLTTEAFLDGAVVFDYTGKDDDHHWQSDPAIAEQTDVIDLLPDPQLRGLLDPWRNAPEELRVGAATSFLTSLLPRRYPAAWESEVAQAVNVVHERERQPTSVHVLRALRERGRDMATEVAEHLEAFATSGLAQLGFADPDAPVRAVGDRQVTCVVTENLPLPGRGVARADYEPSERQGVALVELIALLGMGVLARFPDRLKIQSFDEAKGLLDHDGGRRLIDRAQRLGRSKRLVPVVQTQYATDVGLDRDSIGSLFGTVFAFKAPDAREAERSCELVGVEPEPGLVQRLTTLGPGQALVRDHLGQVELIQVELTPTLLRLVQTNPFERAAAAA